MLGERHVHCDKMLHVGALLHEARRVHPARGGKVSSREERREAYRRTRVETQGRQDIYIIELVDARGRCGCV